jgi:hypothetical protein
MMEATRSSETSVLTRATWRHIQRTTFFIITAVKTPKLTLKERCSELNVVFSWGFTLQLDKGTFCEKPSIRNIVLLSDLAFHHFMLWRCVSSGYAPPKCILHRMNDVPTKELRNNGLELATLRPMNDVPTEGLLKNGCELATLRPMNDIPTDGLRKNGWELATLRPPSAIGASCYSGKDLPPEHWPNYDILRHLPSYSAASVRALWAIPRNPGNCHWRRPDLAFLYIYVLACK